MRANRLCRVAPVITRNDAGKATLNTSYLLGVLTSAAVATAYRPYWARTSSAVFADFGSTIGTDAGMNVFHEFWPAIHNRLQGHSPEVRAEDREKGRSHDGRYRAFRTRRSSLIGQGNLPTGGLPVGFFDSSFLRRHWTAP